MDATTPEQIAAERARQRTIHGLLPGAAPGENIEHFGSARGVARLEPSCYGNYRPATVRPDTGETAAQPYAD